MKKNRFSFFIVGALVFSVAAGLLLQGNPETARLAAPLGVIYVNLIKMIMVPLVFSSLVLGVSSVSDMKKLGKIGGSTVGIFLATTAAAVVIGLILSNLFKPGVGLTLTQGTYEAKAFPSLVDTIVGIVPGNVLDAMLQANMLQIIFIAVVLGIGMVKTGKKGERLKGVIEDIFEVVSCITKGIMYLTPIGIVGLMVPTVAENGIGILLPLLKLIFVFYLAVVIHMGIVYCTALTCLSDFSIKQFLKGMLPAQVIGFVTCSSAAALPVSMRQMQEELGVSKEVTGFVLPFGATVNMDGNALYQGIVALFIAQVYGIEMTIPMQLMVILTGTMASIGAAGVPGAGMIVLSTVLASVGLPIDGIALVAGIDRVLDMGRTLTNVTGDAVTACMVQKLVKEKQAPV